jgi:hypothetical protein
MFTIQFMLRVIGHNNINLLYNTYYTINEAANAMKQLNDSRAYSDFHLLIEPLNVSN